jgi:hypothetical protein
MVLATMVDGINLDAKSTENKIRIVMAHSFI